MSALTRREFVQIGTAGTAGLLLGSQLHAKAVSAQAPPMPERPLGQTGHNVRLFSLGGMCALLEKGKEEQAVAMINRAIDLGVNYLDTAAVYGMGISQTNVGNVMKTRRKEVFLATKTFTKGRKRDDALKQLEESLRMLQTDHVDLWQIHSVGTPEDLEQIFAKDGVLEAMLQAREQKMVRFLGITGHADPDILIEGLNRFRFDTILMALNAADSHYLSFQEKLLPMAVERKMAIIAMKVPGRGLLFHDMKGQARPNAITLKQAYHYVWSKPISTAIIGCDSVEQIEQNVQIAKEFTQLSAEELAKIENMTSSYGKEASIWKRGAAPQGQGHDDHH